MQVRRILSQKHTILWYLIWPSRIPNIKLATGAAGHRTSMCLSLTLSSVESVVLAGHRAEPKYLLLQASHADTFCRECIGSSSYDPW